MSIQRFSAIGNFGIPIDNMGVFKESDELLGLFNAYDIEGTEIPVDIIDITPYYWTNPTFRYLMTRNSPMSPVEVDLMPRHDDSEAYIPVGNFVMSGIRKITLPTDQETMVIIGPGPRFGDQFCIHEAIIAD